MTPLIPNLAIAYVLDLILGDPRWFPHPVRFIGFLIDRGEALLRKRLSKEFLAGAVLTVSLILLSFFSTFWLLRFIAGYSPAASRAFEIFLLYCSLSTKDLAVECGWVRKALEKGDLALARKKLSWVVGRDTESLDEREIARAAVETVAENTVDGIISPLFFAILGGAPAAIAYKTANTLDSMIGHKDERYIRFGRLAAKIDTWANWIPARLTGLLFPLAAAITGFSAGGAFKTAWKDGVSSPVPNSGIPEAAMAGALQVQLGGLNFYKGRPSPTPSLGEPSKPLSPRTIAESIRLMYAASILFFLAALSARAGIENHFL